MIKAVALIFVGMAVMVLGWGQEGHKIVAQIAQNHLSNTAQAAVSEFLDGRYTNLEEIAPLPDSYDHSGPGEWSRTCHYCDLPRSATEFEMQWCGTCCVVGAVSNYTTRVNMTKPRPCSFESDAEPCALEFLVHYMGDIHQPLHVGYGDDRGGNSVHVQWFTSKTNLHAVWDEKIIQKWVKTFDEGTKQLESMLAADPSLWDKYTTSMDPITWADESFDYVKSTVYNYQGDVLEEQYYETNLPIVQDRLLAAGIRLAQTLNDAFSN